MNNEPTNNDPVGSPNQAQPLVKQKNSNKNKILIALLAVLLAAAIGAGVWYWQQQTIDEQNSRLDSLSAQVEKLNEEEAQQSSADEEQVDEVDKQTEYQAEVGKFSLTLPDKHKVVEKIDGGGEGGPSTRISIVDETDKPGVFTSTFTEEIIIFARPLSLSGGSFRDTVDSRLDGGTVIKESTTMVDGVEAEAYVLGGLGNYQRIFFSNNDIFYTIEVSSDHDWANEKLDTVISGFQFN